MVEIFIENIIASATISSELDLNGIINALPSCEYNPGQFSGVIYRPEKPKVVVLLFNDGKIMVTAAKSVEDVKSAMESVEKQLKSAGLLTPLKKEDKEAKEAKEKGEEKAEEKPDEKDEKKSKEKGKEKTEEKPEDKSENK